MLDDDPHSDYVDPGDYFATHQPDDSRFGVFHVPSDSDPDNEEGYYEDDNLLTREFGTPYSFVDLLDSLYHFMPNLPPCTDQAIPSQMTEYAGCHAPVTSQFTKLCHC